MDDSGEFKESEDNYFPPYDKTESIKMGLKIFDTVDDKLMFPLSLKIIDTPGTLM